jgi:tetratricopeptide (TPR) repeat protein
MIPQRMLRNLARLATLAGLALALLSAGPLSAHGDVHESIVALTRRIAQEPRNADLYLRRGELHRVSGELSLALADYRSARRLAPKLDAPLLCASRALVDAGRGNDARPFLEPYLAKHPRDAAAHALSGRVLAREGRLDEAARAYDSALAFESRPTPDLYLERARAAAGAGRAEDALRGIEDGLSRLGPAAALEEAALDLELGLGRFDAALLRIDRTLRGAARKETGLARAGEVLERAGRLPEARDAYLRALAAVQALPPRLRETRATAELEAKLLSSLSCLERKP